MKQSINELPKPKHKLILWGIVIATGLGMSAMKEKRPDEYR